VKLQIDGLGKPRQIHHHQDGLRFIGASKREHLVIGGGEELKIAVPERREAFANRDHPAHPPEERGQIRFLDFHIDRLVVEFGIDIDR